MVESARALALASLREGHQVIVVHLEDGHPGVQGIVASRLVQQFGRPTVVLTPAAVPGMLTGCQGTPSKDCICGMRCSERMTWHRSVCRVSVRAQRCGRGGLALAEKDTFTRALQQAAAKQFSERALNPFILSDGELAEGQLSLETLDELDVRRPSGVSSRRLSSRAVSWSRVCDQ